MEEVLALIANTKSNFLGENFPGSRNRQNLNTNPRKEKPLPIQRRRAGVCAGDEWEMIRWNLLVKGRG